MDICAISDRRLTINYLCVLAVIAYDGVYTAAEVDSVCPVLVDHIGRRRQESDRFDRRVYQMNRAAEDDYFLVVE